MRKRIWLLLSVFALSLCLCFAACAGEEQKTALPTPLGVKLEESVLSWNAVAGGEEYTVKIGEDETTVVKKTTLDLLTVKEKLALGENVICVKANATEEQLESSYSATVRYTYHEILSAPSNVRIEGDALKWDAVEHATAYRVKLGGGELGGTVAGTSLSLASLTTLSLGENKLSVMAVGMGDYESSGYSEEVSYVYRAPFAAPQNVTVGEFSLEGTFPLTWTAVEGAVTYTVKINGDESTTVTTNELDLVSVKEKLVLDNKISVKANADENSYHLESVYSGEVDVRYNAEAIEDAGEYAALVEEIETLTSDHTQEQAAAVKTALDAADIAYGALGEEAKTIAAGVKETFDAKKSAYEQETNAAMLAHTNFCNLIEAAETVMQKEESLPDLEQATERAKEAHAGLSVLAGGLVKDEETGRVSRLEEAVAAWKQDVADAVEALTFDREISDDAAAETLYATATAAIAEYESYKGYVKADEAVAALYASAQTGLTDARTRLDASVAALKTDVDAALGNKNTVTKENYQALLSVQERAAALGAYAKQQFASYKLTEVEAAIAEMPKHIAETVENRTILINPDKDEAKIVIVRRFNNVRDEAIKPEEDPALTASEQLDDGQTNALAPSVVYNETNKTYTVTISITKLAQKGSVANVLTVKYTFTGEEEVTLKINNPVGIRYFNKTTRTAYNENGELSITNGDKTTYVDVYAADAVTWSEIQSDSISFTDVPMMHVPMSEVNSFKKLCSIFAREGIDIFNVRFVTYFYVENEDGTVTVSCMNAASVCMAIEGKITEDDTRLDVFHRADTGAAFNWGLFSGDSIDYAWEFVTGSDLWDGFTVHAFEATGMSDDEIQTYDFMQDEPFFSYEKEGGGYVNWSNFNTVIEYAVEKIISGTDEVKFVFAMQVFPNEYAKELGYRESLYNYATVNKDGKTRAVRVFSPATLNPNNANQVKFEAGGYFDFGRATANEAFSGAGSVFGGGVVKYVELKLQKIGGEETVSVYVFAEDGHFKMYASADKSTEKMNPLDLGSLGNAYIKVKDFEDWFKIYLADPETGEMSFDFTEWSYSNKAYVNDPERFQDGEWSAPTTWGEQTNNAEPVR